MEVVLSYRFTHLIYTAYLKDKSDELAQRRDTMLQRCTIYNIWFIVIHSKIIYASRIFTKTNIVNNIGELA